MKPGLVSKRAVDFVPREAHEERQRPLLSFHAIAMSLALVALVMLYYYCTWGTVMGFFGALGGDRKLASDFLLFYYPAGRDVLVTAKPPDGYLYPIFFALCLVPISHLSLSVAAWVWTALGIVVAGSLFVLPARMIWRKSPSAYYVYLLSFLTSVGVLDTIKWGQVSNLIVLCILLCLWLYHRGYTRSAAVVLALPISIKLYAGFFLLYFLLKRDYRFLVICGITVGLLSIVFPMWVMGAGGWVGFHYKVYDSLNTIRLTARNHAKIQYLPYLVYHWTRGTIHDVAEATFWVRAAWGVVAINLLIINRLIRRGYEDGIFWSFVLLFTSLPLVVESAWPHYFSYLPFCQAFLLVRFAGRRIALADSAKVLGLLGASIWMGSILAVTTMGGDLYTQRHGFIAIADMLLMVLVWMQMPSICMESGDRVVA